MLKYQTSLCDLPVVSLTRDRPGQGLTEQIAGIPLFRSRSCYGPIVLDLRQLRRLRFSEAAALLDLRDTAQDCSIAAVLAEGAVLDRIKAHNLDHILPVMQTEAAVLKQASQMALTSTPAILFCTSVAPLLGPLSALNPDDLCNALGQRPWLDRLEALCHAGVRDVTIVLDADEMSLASAFRAACPHGMVLRFQPSSGGPMRDALTAIEHGLSPVGDIILMDGRLGGDFSIPSLVQSHREVGKGLTVLNGDHDHFDCAVAKATLLQQLGSRPASWSILLDMVRHMGDLATPSYAPDVVNLARLSGLVDDLFSRPQQIVRNRRSIHRSATLKGRNWIADNVVISSDCVVENSILLPGVKVEPGGWLSHMIVAPNWAVDYRFADKLPLNLTPADCVKSPTTTIRKLRRVA